MIFVKGDEMPRTPFKVTNATPILANAVRAEIANQMREALKGSGKDVIRNQIAAEEILSKAGFGSTSIVALASLARSQALIASGCPPSVSEIIISEGGQR